MPPLARSDLLRPSLGDPARLAAAPYSVRATFFCAFFGGPFASASMLALNAWRLGRLRRDVAWAVLIAAAFAGWLVFVDRTAPGLALQARLDSMLGSQASSLSVRLLGLMAFLVGMLLHRREQRSAELFGLVRPNGWIGGSALVAIGFASTFALQALLSP